MNALAIFQIKLNFIINFSYLILLLIKYYGRGYLMTYYYFILQLIICFLLSFLIGLEREFRESSAGLRTNIIVCIGAFLFVSASFISEDDLLRIPAQVVSGIGFIEY